MGRPLTIAVADDDPATREFFRVSLSRLGHQVVTVKDGRQLVELCRASAPDLVITDIRMPGLDGIDAAAEVNREQPIPFILVSAYHDDDLLARLSPDHILAYLVKPLKEENLKTAIPLAMLRFDQIQAARQEVVDLQHTLEERKLIERAKGIVMRRLGMDEQAAFRLLRRRASDHSVKLADVAREVLKAEEVFRLMDQQDGRAGGKE